MAPGDEIMVILKDASPAKFMTVCDQIHENIYLQTAEGNPL